MAGSFFFYGEKQSHRKPIEPRKRGKAYKDMGREQNEAQRGNLAGKKVLAHTLACRMVATPALGLPITKN